MLRLSRPPQTSRKWGPYLWAVLVCGLLLALPASSHGAIAAPGYYVFEFATGLDRPTSLAFGPGGTLYVAEVAGKIVALRDTDGNGVADATSLFQTGLSITTGTVWRSGGLFVSSREKITKLIDTDSDYVADVVDTVVTGLPFGLHQNNGIAFGPDDLLYVTVGSLSETEAGDPLAAAIVRYTEAGDFVDVFATGMRNPYDLAFYGTKGKLYSTDNSPSGDSTLACYEGPDEVNQIVEGGSYGFPNCFGTGDCIDVGCDPSPCGAGDCERGPGCGTGDQPPALLLDPHAAPTGMCFGEGFTGFDGRDLFIAEFGQNIPVGGCPTDFGHRVARIRVNLGGNIPGGAVAETFLADIPRPTDVTVGPDSALYVCDYALGVVYRVIQIGPTGIPGDDGPGAPRLWASPNPARHGTQFTWENAPGGEAVYRVFDIAGRRVAEVRSPDTRPTTWRLTDGAGRRLPAGLYLVRASSGIATASVKLVVRD